jgi:hypothetical protein
MAIKTTVEPLSSTACQGTRIEVQPVPLLELCDAHRHEVGTAYGCRGGEVLGVPSCGGLVQRAGKGAHAAGSKCEPVGRQLPSGRVATLEVRDCGGEERSSTESARHTHLRRIAVAHVVALMDEYSLELVAVGVVE